MCFEFWVGGTDREPNCGDTTIKPTIAAVMISSLRSQGGEGGGGEEGREVGGGE